MFLDIIHRPENVQKHNICINVPSSQTLKDSVCYLVHVEKQLS
jgi:hypothetical protein